MDVLADFLDVAGAVVGIGNRLVGGRTWEYRYAPGTTETSKFHMYAVNDGQVRFDSDITEHSLAKGDVLFVQEGTAHRLTSLSNSICILTGQIEFTSGTVGLSALSLAPMLMVHSNDKSLPNELVDRLAREINDENGGWKLVSLGIVNALFIAALRASGGCENSSDVGNGWLRGMADAEIGAALKLMHQRPEHRWTVAELASELSVSRSAFAARFKSITGRPPLEYLTWWRLQRAAAKLRNGGVTLSEVARVSGYQSEAAFGKAFRREFGVSPGHLRRQSMAKSHTPSQLQLEIKKRNPFVVPEEEVVLNLLRTTETLKLPIATMMGEIGVFGSEYNILRILRGTGVPITHEDVLNQMLIPHEDIQSHLKRLLSVNLIKVSDSTELFSITERGLQVLSQLDAPILSLHRRQFAHFSEGELAEFNRLLVKTRSPLG